MRSSRFDERFRERLFAAQGEVPDRPGLEYEPAVEALVRARLIARYDEPPAKWRRMAAVELGRAERELAKLRAPSPAPVVRSPMRWVCAVIVVLACLGAAVAMAAAVAATIALLQSTSSGPPPSHPRHFIEAPVRCDPALPRCSGDAVNQNVTSGNVTVTVNN